MTHALFGILNLDKPPGMTSRQVVDRVVPLVKPAKAGHAGTLDPLATGVLVVCVGKATRLIPQIQQQGKVYRARFVLGYRSDTDDVDGEVVATENAATVSREQVEQLLPRFTGEIEQVPPRYSAVHVQGRRAYELAREGEEIELPSKRVRVDRLALVEWACPELELEIECGPGTYVRAIGRDLGNELGCGAVMKTLVRTRDGPYRREESISPESLTAETLPGHLLPASTAVSHLPRCVCGPEDLERIRRGQRIHWRPLRRLRSGTTVAVLTPENRLACLAEYRGRDGRLAPKQVYLT